VRALQDVDFTVAQTDLIGIAGATGSGKSTLIQHLNGLLEPTSGRVLVDGSPMEKTPRRGFRGEVGLVFQFPENQLFEATVAEDVAFGPANLGVPPAEIEERVASALQTVGLDPAAFGHRNPFELSGGEKRRAAIAGVLAMRPKILVLDEPTAGLDPVGKRDLMQTLRRLHFREGMGIVVVSHALDEISEVIKRLVILREGRIVFDGRPSVAFAREELLARSGLDLSQAAAFARELRRCGVGLEESAFRFEQVAAGLKRLFAAGGEEGDT